jgi:hypothetical protein
VEEETVIYPARASRQSRASSSNAVNVVGEEGGSIRKNRMKEGGSDSDSRRRRRREEREAYVGFPTTSVEYYPSGATYYSPSIIDSPTISGGSSNGEIHKLTLKTSRRSMTSPSSPLASPAMTASTASQSSYLGTNRNSRIESPTVKEKYDVAAEAWNWPEPDVTATTSRPATSNSDHKPPMVKTGSSSKSSKPSFWSKFKS